MAYKKHKNVKLKITIRNLQNSLPIDHLRIKKIVLGVLASQSAIKAGEITVTFVNDTQIRKLNSGYIGRNEPTDVLSFDLSLDPKREIFADIVVSTDTAIRNSSLFKTTPMNEVYLYVIHGILHLIGFNDKNKKDRLIMRKKERCLLNANT